jgi:hypothetical protein
MDPDPSATLAHLRLGLRRAGHKTSRAGARAWRTAHNIGWVPRHLSGRMRGDTQPGARQSRGVQPGHRLQGDGGSPTDQGTPGVADGDCGVEPLRIRLGAPQGASLREREGLGATCGSRGTVQVGEANRLPHRRRGLVRAHTLLSPFAGGVLTDRQQYFCVNCGVAGECCPRCDCPPGRAPSRRQMTTRPRPVTSGRSSAVTSPGDAAITAGTALTSRMAVALRPAVLWSPSVPMSCRSSV